MNGLTISKEEIYNLLNIESTPASSSVIKKVIIDTNILLDDATILYRLSDTYDKIVFPITVLKELDKLKFKEDTSFSAREAIRSITEFTTNNEDKILFDVENDIDKSDENDMRIIKCAVKHNAVLATKDIAMNIIAKSMGVEVKLHDVVLNNIFDPYIYLSSDELMEIADEGVFSYEQKYSGVEYDNVIDLLVAAKGTPIHGDTWFFIFIDCGLENIILYANHPINKSLYRIDNDPRYKSLRPNGDKMRGNIKALDPYQNCAIFAMIEAPNTLIGGSYGSGKSLLSTAYALTENTDKKTFISRPNLCVDRKFDLGFLPGSESEKLLPWMAGILSSLYYIFSNTKGQTGQTGQSYISYDFVKENIFKEKFDMLPLGTLQGMSFMKDDLVLLDEVQLCSISILSVVLSRFGKGSKLIMTGDLNQIYGTVKPSESGLLKLLRLLPHKSVAYVPLMNNYRSELLELADQLQTKTII